MTANPVPDKPIVLIVDDRPENLLALEAVIEPLDITVIRADSGEDALRRLLTDEVAVIILDVQMPGLDGFETAAHIKRREKTKRIPIIFLTALSTDIEHTLRGYGSGAVDYLSKPFEPDVLRAKVAVFVDLYRYARLIEQQRELLAVRLEERDRAQEALARQAAELERSNAELERFATALSDDVSAPLYVVAGFLDLLRSEPTEAFSAATRTMMEKADAAAQGLFTKVDDLLRYAKATNDVRDPVTVDLTGSFEDALAALAPRLEGHDKTVTSDPLPSVTGDAAQLSRLFTHVLAHALLQPATTEVHVGVSRRRDDWVLGVRNDGESLDDAELAGLFSLVATPARQGDSSRGLDLPIARRIVEHHGGSIWARTLAGRGTTISFSLPAAPEVAS